MLTLNDGRNELWQWDTGRKLTVDADCSQVHFSNKVFGRSIDVDVVDGTVAIPDVLLQVDNELIAWAFVGTPENGYTKISKVFKVNKRNKPADYVFTPPEQTTLEEIKEKLDYLESIQDPDAIKNAVDEYLANNPIQIDEKDPTVSAWAKQATKPKYTATEVGAIATVNGVAPDENGNVQIAVPDSGGSIFIAKYGETTNDEIFSAYEAGKACFVMHNYSVFPAMMIMKSRAYFSGVSSSGTIFIVDCFSDVWSRLNIPKVETISDESTHEEYPSAKAVYDYVAANSGESEIFWVTVRGDNTNGYRCENTLDEIYEAYADGKLLFCALYEDGIRVNLSVMMVTHLAAAFNTFVENAAFTLIIDSTGVQLSTVPFATHDDMGNLVENIDEYIDNRIDEKLAESDSGGNADYVGVEPAYDDIPKVFFGGALQQTKDEAVVPFRYISKTDDFSGFAKIKAQGNSSMNYPKKNQTAKMFADEACNSKLKKNFKGWGKQNKHVYKANWIDLSHSRNIVSARLWADVVKSRANYANLPELLRTSPNQGAVDGFPVKVYAAGVYQGRYTLNIPKDKWTFNMDDKLDEHCVLCGENYVSGCFRASAQINESDWTDEIHDTCPDSIKTRWNEVISFVMNSTDEDFRANLSQYFYVDSLIDYYLFGLASCGLDAFGKNQIYATYDGQRWIASMYDMDSTWGLYWNGSKFVATDYARTSYEDYVHTSGNLLYNRLEQLFSADLQTRWTELKNGALSITNIINRFERFTDITPAELVKEDYASTTGGGKFTGIPSQTTNNIQQIRAFALARQAWTDAYVASLTPAIPIPCEGITLDKNTLTFTAEGTQTVTATVVPDGCTDNMVWVSSNPEIAGISVDGYVCAVEALANGNATITVTCGEHSASCAVAVSGLVEPVPCTGITLDKMSLTFNSEESQTITAIVTPTDTTDRVVWSSDNEGVVLVENGVVTAVQNGSATITATCGNQTAICTVSVTIPVEPVYSLPQATSFDGSNYIDTNVQLFAEDKPFTVLLDWTHTGDAEWKSNSHVVAHCMHEESPWNGLVVQYNTQALGIQCEIRQTSAVTVKSASIDGIPAADLNNLKVAFVKEAGGLLTICRRYNNSGEVFTSSTTGKYVAITQNLLLGCYQTTDGTKGRYAKGVMNACEVYDYAMTADEINAYMNA